ncbi:MAG: zinc-binding dehydrogenase [Ignavibacteria bacterium]|nr:zinc-binding dehydrogenase [Ignavibacteria bacterium]MCU7502184.1 zinc-binding dehydrogenase [Ignavibacteria bacterium]MCU7517401.1 zinc-binding dehydrogenase [Ignavibacteria bacterium]
MRSAIFQGPGQVAVRYVAKPEPAQNEVLIRLLGCGLCSSNLPVFEGRSWFNYPFEPGAPGHEGWGIIEEVGKDVKDLEPGQSVAALSYHAYAEYDTAPAENVVRLPDELKDRPFPGEPLGCAMNIFKRSLIKEGQTVAIIGIGFLGALLSNLASKQGARVIAISRRPFSLEIAKDYGASESILMDDHWRIIEEVRSLTGGEFCDCVIEATGHQWPLDLAGELTRVRGRLIIAGYHQDGPRQVNMQLWNWRGLDVINTHEREQKVYMDGIRAAVDAVIDGKMDPFPLITHSFTLDQISKAFEVTAQRPEGFLKAVINLK